MDEHSWDVDGVDAETRERAAAEAARLGLSLSDYLAAILAPSPDDEAPSPEIAQKNSPARYRIDALERRVKHALGSLESAVQALDVSVVELAERLADTEGLAQDAAKAAYSSARELGERVTGIADDIATRKADAEAQARSHGDAHGVLAAQIGGISQRLDRTEDIAHGARQTSDTLFEAHEALKRAVAEDFSALAQDTALHISAGLESIRGDADAAASRAEAAHRELLGAFATFRDTIDGRIDERAEETRARIEAIFAQTTSAVRDVNDRVTSNEQAVSQSIDALHRQIAMAEHATHEALEETSRGFGKTQQNLAQELSRSSEDQRAKLAALKTALSTELTEVRNRQADLHAQLKTLKDADAANAIDLARLQEALTLAEAALHERIGGFEMRAAAIAGETEQVRRATADDVARVEACTMAALEKLAGDIAQGDEQLARAGEATERALAESREAQETLEDELAELRGAHAGVVARLQLFDRTLGSLASSEDEPVMDRLSALEQGLADQVARLDNAVGRAETEQALSLLRDQVTALTVRIAEQKVDEALAQKVDDLRARLATQEVKAAQASHRVQGLAMSLGRVTTQGASSTSQTEQRIAKIEQTVAEIDRGKETGALSGLQRRLAELESRQLDAFEKLRRDIALFIDENDRRLASLEDGGAVAPVLQSFAEVLDERFAAIENRDLATQFDDLRLRIEERVVGVEQRSVHALEQLGDTVALIERRLLQAVENEAAKKAS